MHGAPEVARTAPITAIIGSIEQVDRPSKAGFSSRFAGRVVEHVVWPCLLLTKLLNALAPGSICIFTTGGIDAPSEITDTAMGVPMYTGALGIPATLELINDADCVCRHLEYDQYPEPHLDDS